MAWSGPRLPQPARIVFGGALCATSCLATNLNRLGVDDSVIQRILRHSNVAVTQACYIKTASEDAKAAMQKLETALNDTYVTPRQPNSGTKAVM